MGVEPKVIIHRISWPLVLLVSILVVEAMFCSYTYLSWNPGLLWRSQQEELAKKLGVNQNDYRWPYAFPFDYYKEQMPQGASINQVHDLVVDYAHVYHCLDDSSGPHEVYYFFGFSDDLALRMELIYNADYHFIELRTEDPNSSSISLIGCEDGRLVINSQ